MYMTTTEGMTTMRQVLKQIRDDLAHVRSLTGPLFYDSPRGTLAVYNRPAGGQPGSTLPGCFVAYLEYEGRVLRKYNV